VYEVLLSVSIITGGRHVEYIAPDTLVTALKISFPDWFIWIWATTFVKLTVVFMLLRIKKTVAWQRGLKTLASSLVVVAIVATITQTLQCGDLALEENCRSPAVLKGLEYGYAGSFNTPSTLCTKHQSRIPPY
jgi:hypothetical protein